MSNKTFTLTEFQEALKKMSANVRAETLKKAAMAGGRRIETYAKINVERTFKQLKGGGEGLSGSINTKVIEYDDAHAEVAVGPSVVYGRIQEFGGTIKPAVARYLAIPKNAPVGSRPRDFQGQLHPVMRPDKSGGVLMDDNKNVMFVLEKEVTLPARPYLRPAVDEHEKDIYQAIAVTIGREIEQAFQ